MPFWAHPDQGPSKAQARLNVKDMALGHIGLYRFPIEKKRLCHQKKYQNIFKYIQDIQDKYKIPSGRRPGSSPGPRMGRPRTPRPRTWAALGPGRTGGRLIFCIYWGYLGYLRYILDIFGYMFNIFHVYFWYTVCVSVGMLFDICLFFL